VRACAEGELELEPALVIASNSKCLDNLLAAGLSQKQIKIFSPKELKLKATKQNTSRDDLLAELILKECQRKGIDIIGQYGWLLKTPAQVIEAYPETMINQHPGPLDPGRPDFGGHGMYGLRVHAARLKFAQEMSKLGDDGHWWTEATAQQVAVEFDEGAVLKTARVEILRDDTAESLAARVLAAEHQLQIDTLKELISGQTQAIKRSEALIPEAAHALLTKIKSEIL